MALAAKIGAWLSGLAAAFAASASRVFLPIIIIPPELLEERRPTGIPRA
jgi:hypothetical protein